MARAFWKGVISFGMVAIPVRMSTATENKTPGFHYLHKKCLTRPKQVLYCETDDEYITVKDTVRGYEYAKEQHVVFEEEDFAKVPVKTAHTIDIIGFVDIDEIDPLYYNDSHYLEPEDLGVKPYTLLWEVLGKTKRVGVAKVAFQRREHLCCLRPLGDILALHTLYFSGNIIPADDIHFSKPALTKEEREMAVRLVEAMSAKFEPEKYKDEYSDALNKMVEAKLQGVEIEAPEIPRMEIEDLMAALKASVAAAGAKG